MFQTSVLLLFYILFLYRKVFPSIISTNVKLSGQDIELIGGLGKRNAPTTTKIPSPQTLLKSSNKLSPSLSNHQNDKSSMPSPPPPPSSVSRSPSPSLSPSLSPLQQLIQATKTQTKPSPLLKSKKVPSHNSIKLKRPQVNGTPISTNSLFSTSHSIPTLSSLPLSVPISNRASIASVSDKKEGEVRSGRQESIGNEERKHVAINGTNEMGMDLLKMKLFGVTGKRERNSIESDSSSLHTKKKQKTELSEITNRSWTPSPSTNTLLPITTVSLSNTSLHSQKSSESAQRSSDSAQRSSESAQRSLDSAQRSSESAQRSSESAQKSSESAQRLSDSAQRSSISAQRSVSPANKRSTSPSVLSSASTLLIQPVSASSSSSVSGEQIQSNVLASSITKYSCLWDNCLM